MISEILTLAVQNIVIIIILKLVIQFFWPIAPPPSLLTGLEIFCKIIGIIFWMTGVPPPTLLELWVPVTLSEIFTFSSFTEHLHQTSAWYSNGWRAALWLHLHSTILHSQQHLVSFHLLQNVCGLFCSFLWKGILL